MRQQFYMFQNQHKVIASIMNYGWILIKSYIFVFILTTYVIKPICVQGSSMYPTLKEGNIGVSSIFTKTINGIGRFDIVIVKVGEELWAKRVIALPNESIAYKNDELYINGEIIEEPYFDTNYVQRKKDQYNTSSFTEDFGPIILGDKEYFLMGDNRHISLDSRVHGAFHEEEIISKDTFIFIQ